MPVGIRSLDEPMLLAQSDAAYRLRLSGLSGPLVVRVERTGTQAMLVVKVAHGNGRRQPVAKPFDGARKSFRKVNGSA